MALAPELVPNALSVVLQLALGAGVLYLNFWNRAHRALALVLLARAVFQLTEVLASAAEGAAAAYWARLGPYFFLTYYAALLYFPTVYPRLLAPLARLPVPALPFLAAAGGLCLLHAWDPSLAEPGAPLNLLLRAFGLVFPLLALRFAVLFAQAPEGRGRRSLLLVSAGFALIEFHDNVVGSLAAGLALVLPEVTLGVGGLIELVELLAFLGLVAYLVRGAGRGAPAVAGAFRGYLLLLAAGAATAVVLVIAALARVPEAPVLAAALAGLWNLTLPLLLTYALVRFQLLDIDLKVRWTIRRGTLAAAFVAVFFVASQAAQAFLEDSLGWATGGIVAGLMLFAIAPLQRAAERVALAAVPAAPAVTAAGTGQAAHLYREQCRVAWSDGVLDRKERAMLDALRGNLGLSMDEAGRLEREASAE